MAIHTQTLHFRLSLPSFFGGRMEENLTADGDSSFVSTFRGDDFSPLTTEVVGVQMNCKQTRASSVTDPRTRRRLERDNNRPPTPPPPLPPPAVAIDTTPPSFTCDNCGKVILSTADHIIIRPCTHTLCGCITARRGWSTPDDTGVHLP